MSRGWQKSNLKVGDEVRISSALLIAGDIAAEKLVRTTYIGESSTGLLLDLEFVKEQHYKMFINWASIWCGQVKVYRDYSTLIEAKRLPGRPLAYEVLRG